MKKLSKRCTRNSETKTREVMKWGFAWLILYPLFKALFGMRIEGTENVRRKKRVIIAPNHISSWDPPLVGVASPRELYFLAKEDLFIPNVLFRWLITTYNAIPIKRETGGKDALKKALKLLKEEKAVVIFPEGTRNKTEKELLPFKEGVALLAIKTNSPVVPTCVKGPRKPFWTWVLRKEQLKVKFGKPLYPSNFKGKDGMHRLTEEIEKSIRRMLHEK